MNLQSTDFELFGLRQQFVQDREVLDAIWKALQRRAHPDRFAAQGAVAQRVALQWSARVNEAYQRLREPLKRAAYLCELAGAPINAHSNTAMPAQFLVQQMEWREQLDDAKNLASLEILRENVAVFRQQLLQQCEQLLDVQHDYAGAVLVVRELMFIEKFSHDLDCAFDQFE